MNTIDLMILTKKQHGAVGLTFVPLISAAILNTVRLLSSRGLWSPPFWMPSPHRIWRRSVAISVSLLSLCICVEILPSYF